MNKYIIASKVTFSFFMLVNFACGHTRLDVRIDMHGLKQKQNITPHFLVKEKAEMILKVDYYGGLSTIVVIFSLNNDYNIAGELQAGIVTIIN